MTPKQPATAAGRERCPYCGEPAYRIGGKPVAAAAAIPADRAREASRYDGPQHPDLNGVMRACYCPLHEAQAAAPDVDVLARADAIELLSFAYHTVHHGSGALDDCEHRDHDRHNGYGLFGILSQRHARLLRERQP